MDGNGRDCLAAEPPNNGHLGTIWRLEQCTKVLARNRKSGRGVASKAPMLDDSKMSAMPWQLANDSELYLSIWTKCN